MSKSLEKKETESMEQALIRICQNPEIEPERLEKFLDLQIKMEDRQAEKSLNEALAKFQSECPIIKRTKRTHNSDYAPIDEIVYEIRPILQKCGLSYSFAVENKNENENEMTVTIRHISGGKFESKYTFPRLDDGGKMNTSQKSKSANTYAKRVSLENALGIVTQGVDDDAARAIDEQVTEDQIAQINELLEKTETNLKNFCSYMKVGNIGDLSRYEAKKAITQLKQKRVKTQGAK